MSARVVEENPKTNARRAGRRSLFEKSCTVVV